MIAARPESAPYRALCDMLSLLLAAIQLVGVEGSDLRARAFFDANNVKVGDPMVLTIDFLGEADFKDLHPPALAKAVGRKDWKLDDISAKTDTFRDARRLTYRVRPMREGAAFCCLGQFCLFCSMRRLWRQQ